MRGLPAIAWALASCAAMVGATMFAADSHVAASAQTQQQINVSGFKPAIRRITESQYRHTIADVFGPGIKINARFEPEKREAGLLAVGSAELSVTTSGLEQYFALASSIADQAMDEKVRATNVGCEPANAKKADSACARAFIKRVGERLFRRPLSEPDIVSRVATADRGATQSGDFHAGLKLALTSLLIAPEFLFRMEVAEPLPGAANRFRLDAYSTASRLSFLFWDTSPDAELMAAAKSGAIQTDAGLQKQIARLAGSPRLEEGARAFFIDMLQFDQFENLNKDAATYPKFSQAVADSAREQTLKTLLNLLITRKQDYREIFTSNDTFLNRPLAAIYKVPYASSKEWAPYTFPESSERSGILTQVAFLSLFSHPGASSPTRRGVKLHEIFMCQPTPDPPADVDFSKVQALANGTVRTRLLDHMINEGCAVCHRASDPPGLALEHFDGLGQLRTTENGVPIDVSAEINGKKFTGAQGLGRLMHDNADVTSCVVKQAYSYGIGKTAGYRDEDYLADQTAAFAKAGYQIPKLFEAIASSPEFYAVSAPAGLKIASGSTPVPKATP